MRVIAGLARGLTLKVPPRVTRPTTDRVKESLFGVLQELLEQAVVADFFAGSGSLGIEALSRGAKSCDFVESDHAAARVIEANLKKSKLPGGRVIQREVGSFASSARGYDVVFADPPYAKVGRDFSLELVEKVDWQMVLNDEGLLVLEQEAEEKRYEIDGLSILREREYGCTRIVIYQKTS